MLNKNILIIFSTILLLIKFVSSDESVDYQLNNSTVIGNNDCLGYKLTSIREFDSSLEGLLSLIDEGCNKYSSDIKELMLTVTYDSNRLRVQIFDYYSKSFKVPDHIFTNRVLPLSKDSGLKFEYQTLPFSFRIVRKSDNTVLFDTLGHTLIFEQGYLELSSSLVKEAEIYGLGETVDTFRRDPDNTTQAMWARDVASPIKENLYGTFPYYIQRINSQLHGVHVLNSYGMDISLETGKISYKVLGGGFDFSFFEGPTHKQVSQQFTATYGRPHRVNYWSLGFQQCKWGYKDLQEVEQVVEDYKTNNIPLEAMWIDIDYMDKFKDFTYDPVKFPLEKLTKFADKLHDNKQRFVLILDPAISNTEGYEAYDLGLKKDVFLKNPDGTNYIGQVWPGYTVFPDWFHPKIQQYWNYLIDKFIKETDVDGIWIDMNEPASFCLGSCGTNKKETQVTDQEEVLDSSIVQEWKEPNYAIHNFYGNLSLKTVATTAKHANNLTQFQVHNLYGHMEAMVTNSAIKHAKPNLRPFVMSRSTFTGSGAFTGHWTGDNLAYWEYLKYSISGILNFNMFGIPYVGADICGFKWDTTEELCLRWMQLGSLYTFSRNHNNKWSIPQEPYRWEKVAAASRRALKIRYELIPYLYTLMETSATLGHMVWIPMPFKFNEELKMKDLEGQFMLGDALMIAPVLEKGATNVEVIFPKGRWYDYYSYKEIEGDSKKEVKADLQDHMPIFIYGGSILPVKKTKKTILTLDSMDDLPYTLIIALDRNFRAEGKLYLDDGVSTDTQGKFNDLRFEAKMNLLKVTGSFNFTKNTVVDRIVWLGLPANHLALKSERKETKGEVVGDELVKVKVEGTRLVLENLNLKLDGNLKFWV